MKTFKQFCIVLVLMIVALTLLAPALALAANSAAFAGVFVLPESSAYGSSIQAPPEGSAELQFTALVFGIINNVKYIIGAVAILMAVCRIPHAYGRRTKQSIQTAFNTPLVNYQSGHHRPGG